MCTRIYAGSPLTVQGLPGSLSGCLCGSEVAQGHKRSRPRGADEHGLLLGDRRYRRPDLGGEGHVDVDGRVDLVPAGVEVAPPLGPGRALDAGERGAFDLVVPELWDEGETEGHDEQAGHPLAGRGRHGEPALGRVQVVDGVVPDGTVGWKKGESCVQ